MNSQNKTQNPKGYITESTNPSDIVQTAANEPTIQSIVKKATAIVKNVKNVEFISDWAVRENTKPSVTAQAFVNPMF